MTTWYAMDRQHLIVEASVARLVVLYVDENEVAEGFALEGDAIMSGVGHQVVGLYAVPTKFCDCMNQGLRTGFKIAMGQKYGWRIHRACGLPVPGNQCAKNLLEGAEWPEGSILNMLTWGSFKAITGKVVSNLHMSA